MQHVPKEGGTYEAGTKFIVEHGQVPKTSSVTNDHRFTLLPLTAASGHVVICVVIFQVKSSKIPAIWASGIDAKVEPVKGSDDIIKMDGKENFGPGK
jgi:hypothetical protein